MQTLPTLNGAAAPNAAAPFLTINNVTKVYPTPKGPYPVLDGIDLEVQEG
jgi:ABC-type glutathione transport system ATPase component